MADDILEQISKLREQIDGTESEEAERLAATESTVKKALLVKDFGNHPAVQMLRLTLERRIGISNDLIIAMATGMPDDEAGIFRFAIEMRQITARKTSYEWFLKLFTAADSKLEVINTRLGKMKRK